MKHYIKDETAMQEMGAQIAKLCPQKYLIYLIGDLGAGKTTFCRGFLRGLGYTGKVKSPTYTLVESYQVDAFHVYHFDLYRLSEPAELEYIGWHDYISAPTICLVEWPEKGETVLPAADLTIQFEFYEEGRMVTLLYNK